LAGIHPTVISESFQRAAVAAVEVLHDMSVSISLSDRATLLKAASTSLSSKIVSSEPKLADFAVDSVLKVIDPKTAENADLKNIRILKKSGGTIEESEMIDGLVLNQQVLKSGGGPTRIEKARIGLIQFQLSAPKPDMENQIVVNDYRQMDKILKEERTYLLNMVKKIKKAKCNVLFIQKSILRDAVNELSLHFLSKLNILTVKDIERDEVEFLCKVCKFTDHLKISVLIIRRALDANQSPILTPLLRKSWEPLISSKKFNLLELVLSRSLASREQPKPYPSSFVEQMSRFLMKPKEVYMTHSASFVA
jgi:chaperonin GroEL (HSP60 family)